MNSVLAPLAGILIAAAVYLILCPRAWQRLIGIALMGQGMPLLILAVGGSARAAVAAGVLIAVIAFALFLAAAAALRSDSAERAPKAEEPG